MQSDHKPSRSRGMSGGPHAGWFRDRLAENRILDVGGEERARRGWRSRGARRLRRMALGVGAVLALGFAAIGVALALTSGDVPVSMSAASYRVGGATLRAVAPGVYQGEGVMVVVRLDGALRAGASAMVGGTAWRGVCELSTAGDSETCRWLAGDNSVTARDVWSEGRWRRTYSDGVQVAITAARGVPVPFPVGR